MFAFAVEGEPKVVEGAAPYTVQARQIPRLLVARLNAERDVGVRFFPFMGMVGDRRRFFDLDQPFDPDELRSLHGQGEVRLLVDGSLTATSIRMRVHQAGAGGRTLLELELPFDPVDPWPALQRFMFELTGLLDWVGPVPILPEWRGAVLGWFWIAKDDQLALEAEIAEESAQPLARLRAATEAFQLVPDDSQLSTTLLETVRTSLARRSGEARAVGTALHQVVREAGATAGIDFIFDAAQIVELTVGMRAALPLFMEIVARDPLHSGAAQKAGLALFRFGRTGESLVLLRSAFEAGNRDPSLRAQLAAAEEENGNSAQRDQLLAGLADETDLSIPVARLVASYLVDHERAADSLELIDRVRSARAGAEHAGLWLERGRALLTLERAEDARDSLSRCLAMEPSDEVRAEARRLLRLAGDAELMPAIRGLEDSLREEDLRAAAQRARSLVRERPQLAEAWLLLGVVRQRLAQPRRAVRAFERALHLQPDLGDAHNRLGVLLASRGRDLEGYDHLRRAVELIPHDASPWLHLAQVCLRLSYREEATAAFAHAERLGGHDAEVAAIRDLFDREDAG